jgi:F-type H+-transporting ATPase subunit b
LEALGINGGFLLVQIVNLIIVYVVVSKWIVAPIIGMLEKRRETIANGLEDARVAAEARANAEKDAQKIIADAQAKASQIVREATERAEVVGHDVQAAAQAEASRAHEKALTALQEERDQLLADLRGQMAALSIAATQKLVGEALDEKRQRVLIDEFFSGVKSGKIVMMEDAKLSGTSAEITSALPLTDDEKKTVQQDVINKTGAKSVAFHIDPAILGGLIIKVGDKVLDGSVSGKLESLRSSLH